MTLTIVDLEERLKQLDEVSILELLEINSEEIVDRFYDKIEDKLDKLEEELE